MNTTSKLSLVTIASLVGLVMVVFADDHDVAVISADTALAKLKEGNARFCKSDVSAGKPTAAKRSETAKGQHPFAVVLACADSRTSPEIVFDENIGDLFVIRNAGNLVDDHGLGSIEYAVEHLGVRLVVVLGHKRCGAVQAALAGEHAPGHIESLVHDIQSAVKASSGKKGDVTDLTVAENARLMAGRIRTEVTLGDLAKETRIIPAVYDLDTGKVEWLEH